MATSIYRSMNKEEYFEAYMKRKEECRAFYAKMKDKSIQRSLQFLNDVNGSYGRMSKEYEENFLEGDLWR